MKTVDSVIKYIRARPAIIILTACAFAFFFAASYFALAMILPFAYRTLAFWAAIVISAGITASIVRRHLEDV